MVLNKGRLSSGDHKAGFGFPMRISYLSVEPTTEDSKQVVLVA
jgi:hypothetical protein